MNKAFPVLLAMTMILVPGWVLAETYTVMWVNGSVTADGVAVKPWAELSSDARLVFGDEGAALRVLDGRKTFTLSGKRVERRSSGGELTAFLKDTFDPVSPVKRASARGLITTKQDLRVFLAASTNPERPQPFLVIGTGRYTIPPDVFRLDGDHYLFLHYRYQGEEIDKMLPSVPGNGFEISPDIFVLDKGTAKEIRVDPARIEGGITVHYAIDERHDEKLGGFRPVFVSPADLEREVMPLVRGWRGIGAGTGEIRSAVGQYLVENYGEPGEEALSAWLEARFGLK